MTLRAQRKLSDAMGGGDCDGGANGRLKLDGPEIASGGPP